MNFPHPGDYIDIHNHGARPAPGIFNVETLMAHEERMPQDNDGMTYSYGIHPWHLSEKNHDQLIRKVMENAGDSNVALIGEAGFDRIKGPSADLQRRTFEEQARIAEEHGKPMVIHCVRAWDDLLMMYKKLKPEMPWLIHGFRGKPELASQLTLKGMYISFWFEFVMRPESVPLLKSVPAARIFLETDGADIDIRDIYNKVSADLDINLQDLKARIYSNFCGFFDPPTPLKGGKNPLPGI